MSTGPSREQLFNANARRGYNKRWIFDTCKCNHARVEHADRANCCAAPSCLCQKFVPMEPPPMPGYNFNTALRRSAPPDPPPPEDRPVVLQAPKRPVDRVPQPSADELAASQKGGVAERCPYCNEARFNMIASLQCRHCKAWQHAVCVRRSIRCAACKKHWN